MNFDFYKIHTGKNDLVLINLMSFDPFPLEHLPVLSRRLCRRREGIGANGIIYLFKGKAEPLKLRYFRPDGEESTLCNDALLCLARYVFDSGLAGKNRMTVESLSGLTSVDLLDSQNFRLNLGAPLSWERQPLSPDPEGDFSRNFLLGEQSLSLVPVFLQKRGAVFLDGGEFRGRHRAVSEKLNQGKKKKDKLHPVFVTIHSRDEISVDSPLDTLNGDHASSCALGAVGSVLAGLTDSEIFIQSRHSRYFFQWDRKTEQVFLTGSATYAFSGSYYFDES